MKKFILTISLMAGILSFFNIVGVVGACIIDEIHMRAHPENYIPSDATLEDIHRILNQPDEPTHIQQQKPKGIELI